MRTQQEKFIKVLEEMFQFDQAELDFGIYRIMNQKREEITRFLKEDLVPQVRTAFEKYKDADVETIKEEISRLEKQLADVGVAKESSEKYVSLQNQLKRGVDVVALENEVFSELTNFFKRYYYEGDFISLRRYKKDVYAIPYQGEEVKLHWANNDQYYVKSTEDFRDYSFTLPSGKVVNFKLVEASTEQNNNKVQEGKERRFILHGETPLIEENGELIIRFEFRVDSENRKREKVNEETIEYIFKSSECQEWIEELKSLTPTEKNKKRTLLEKHLNDYTAKNSFDYFIHKDLGGFLKRELDFFIKNEVMHLDDLDTENEKRFEQYLSKIKVIKSIGTKIIKFLEQIENFQKKLWLKKKFVIDTNYCLTLDRVPEEFFVEIINNREQIEEWKRLFLIDEMVGDIINPGYTEPLTLDFIKNNLNLILDTKFFDEEFKHKLLSTFENIDDELDGLLINSENFQALNLLTTKYSELIQTTYIDPPYNTEKDREQGKFLYKDNFEHSSWLCMMDSRTKLLRSMLSSTGTFFCSIGDDENTSLRKLLDQIYNKNNDKNFKAELIWKKRNGGGNDSKFFAIDHEYVLSYTKDSSAHIKKWRVPYDEEYLKRYKEKDENGKFYWDTLSRPGLQSPIIYKIECPDGSYLDGMWQLSEQEFLNKLEVGDVRITKNKQDEWTVHHKVRMPEGRVYRSIIDTVTNTDAANEMEALFNNKKAFSNPKPTKLIMNLLTLNPYEDGYYLDCFAGSGTTGQAVINLNDADEGKRKYILIEMGEYFENVLKPRIQKVIYSKDWNEGKPVSRKGSSHIFKYQLFESYEDTLNNIELNRTKQQMLALDNNMPSMVKEDYYLSYIFDVESEGSVSLLNQSKVLNPFDYKMKISNGNETTLKKVDIIETFNYLLGVKVKEMDFIRGYQLIKGRIRTGENVLIIWRNLFEKSNEDLEDFLSTLGINSRDFEYDRIYINGDNHIENLKIDESEWKVVLIEEEFKRLMFDVQDI